ncbi:MAG TPA: hypothetical protein VKR22_02070 [Acidimicrobiales bacterium]|nr:hypothetical protein [Acidimicrobiales bacterium]
MSRAPVDRALARIERQGQLALARIQQTTLLRCAEVQAEAIVQGEKLHEIDRLVDDAISDQAFLYAREGHWAGEDPVLRSDLHFFSDMAKLAKGELIGDTVTVLRRI